MATISMFFGIVIHMYIRGEHNPPHFHALYGEYEALVVSMPRKTRIDAPGALHHIIARG